VLLIAAAAALGFLIGRDWSVASSQVVTVEYPEQQWKVGDWRQCMTGAKDPRTGLYSLDCDMNARETPADSFFDMSVRFSTKIPPKVTHLWQCQRDAKSLVCNAG
jgi:hypothetical protein